MKTMASLKYLSIGHFGQDPLSYFRAPAGPKRGAADFITFLVYGHLVWGWEQGPQGRKGLFTIYMTHFRPLFATPSPP